MKPDSYQWIVDQEQETQERAPTNIEFKQEGLHVQVERIPLGEYAAVLTSYVDTKETYTMAPNHVAPADDSTTLSFIIATSGRAMGKLPDRDEFLLDPSWGMITDFTEGASEFVIDPGEPMQIFGGTLSMKQVMTLFHGDHLLDEIEKFLPSKNMVRSFEVTSTMRSLITEALAAPLRGAPRRLYLEGVMLQLFALIFQTRLSEAVKKSSQGNYGAIKAAAKMVEQNLALPPKLLELSESTGLSARKIREGFKEVYGMTLVDFLLEKRMDSARNLIRSQPDYPLKTLASQVGYNHVSNFTRAFKSHFGTTPAAFAKEQIKREGTLPANTSSQPLNT